MRGVDEIKPERLLELAEQATQGKWEIGTDEKQQYLIAVLSETPYYAYSDGHYELAGVNIDVSEVCIPLNAQDGRYIIAAHPAYIAKLCRVVVAAKNFYTFVECEAPPLLENDINAFRMYEALKDLEDKMTSEIPGKLVGKLPEDIKHQAEQGHYLDRCDSDRLQSCWEFASRALKMGGKS